MAVGIAIFILLANPAQADELTKQEREYLRQKGAIVFVSQSHYPPFEFMGEDGDHTGMCIELARWIATRFGFKTRFIDTSFKQAQEAVLTGKADVITSLFYSKKRDQEFDFTQPMFQVPVSIFVAAERPDIKDLQDLDGKVIAMQAGDYAQEFLESKHIKFKVAWTKNFAEATNLVIAGKADAVIGDEQIVLYHLYANNLTRFIKKVGEPLYVGQICMGVKQDRHLLQSILNKGISLAKRTGTLERINTTWLGVHYKVGEPFIMRYLPQFAAAVAAILLLALLAWLWNLRLRSLVARRTEALARSEETLQAILAKSPLGIGLVKNRVLDWQNETMRTMLGYQPGELEGKVPLTVFPSPEEYHRTDAAINQSLRQRGDARVETKLVRKDGSAFDCLLHCALLQRRAGEATMIVIAQDISDRKRTERALQQNERTIRDLMNAPPLTALLIDNKGNILMANQAYAASTGKEVDELLGTNVTEIYSPEVTEATKKAALQVIGSGQPTDLEIEINGRIQHLSFYPLLDAAGRVERLAVYGQDITEQKRAGEALRKSEEQFRFLTEGMTDIIWTVDLDLQTTYVSPSVAKTLGFTPEERKRQSLEEMLTPESVQRVREVFGRELRLEAAGADPDRSVKIEVEYYRKDGSTLWVENVMKAIRNASGEVIGMHGVSRDISERKRAEEELARSEQQYRLLAENVADVIWTLDKNLNFTYVSPSVEKLRGFTPEEIMAQSIEEVLTPQSLEKVREFIREVFAKIKKGYTDIPAITKELEQPCKDGSTVWTEAVVNVVFDEDGNFSHFQGVTRDITERKKLEAQLREAQKMQSLGTLSGGIAHEFNNILAVIMGYAELALADTAEFKSAAPQLKRIVQAVKRARDLVRQILTFSRQMETEMKPLNLGLEVQQIIELLKRTLPRTIHIEAKLAPELNMIRGNANQIEQVLINLASNARDAMPQGGNLLFETSNVEVDEELARRRPGLRPGSYVLLRVSDTGQGMDQSVLEQAFDPCFTTKEVGKGTGLGLSTVHGIVQFHGGHIYCHSRPGQGTVVEIHLPALPADQAAAAPEKSLGEWTPLGKVPGRGERILLVDDEPDLRALGANFLEAMGYQVFTAQNGEEALEIFSRNEPRPELVILDLGMPGMGGEKCLKEIMAVDPRAKVIVASGYLADEKVKESLRAGAASFVAKPFQRAELAATVRQVLDEGRP
jgi:PAS domain S-box-containing protein